MRPHVSIIHDLDRARRGSGYTEPICPPTIRVCLVCVSCVSVHNEEPASHPLPSRISNIHPGFQRARAAHCARKTSFQQS